MKKTVYKALKRLGYTITNDDKRKLEISNQVKEFGILSDVNNIVFRSMKWIKELKEFYPELKLESEKNGVIVQFNNLKFFIESPEEFYILSEVFVEKDYNFLSNDNFVVFDIGMNIGTSSLFFSKMENVHKVYSFEPALITYNQAKYNFDLNPEFSNKIEAFNFGLGGSTRVEKVFFDHQAKGNCGIRLELSPSINLNRAVEIDIPIKDVQTIIPSLIEKHTDKKIFFKIDCEGAEYEIIERLSEQKIFNFIDYLVIEWHDKGATSIEKILLANNFNVISRNLGSISGIIYAIKKV
ncbi:FkbM family methyltransferase [Flavobacterium koreense]